VWLDEVLGRTRYVAGSSYTIADMTALIAVDLGIPSVYEIGPDLEHLGRWWSEVSARPASKELGLGGAG